MKRLAEIVVASILIFSGSEFSVAQVNNSNTNQAQTEPTVLSPGKMPLDEAYMPEEYINRRVVPPAPIREADVMWSKRVWRIIDTRQKINEPLYYPEEPNGNRMSLFSLLTKALLDDKIYAYSFNPSDLDDIGVRLTQKEITSQLSSIDTVTDENGNQKAITNDITSDKVRGYMIKEDWIFDKQRSVMEPRILWICPLIASINKNTGLEDATLPPTYLFWISFPEIRPLLARTPVYNWKNDAARLTFDDIFWKRQFSSYIVQQSNVFDRTIAAYLKGTDALLEGEKINNHIRNVEIDMWQY